MGASVRAPRVDSEFVSCCDRRLRQVIAAIRRSNRRLDVQELASATSLSPSRLRHLFKEETGFTVMQFQRMAKLGRAAKLLASTELSVKQVAGRVGFMSESHFDRLFKKQYGVTPREFRRRAARLGNE